MFTGGAVYHRRDSRVREWRGDVTGGWPSIVEGTGTGTVLHC